MSGTGIPCGRPAKKLCSGGPECRCVGGWRRVLRELVDEVKKHAYSPQFEHTGPILLDAEAVLAASPVAADTQGDAK